jgi:hypothetical protein
MKRILYKLLSQINKTEALLDEQRMRRSPNRNIHNILWKRAAEESANFVENHLGSCLIFQNKKSIWNYVIQTLDERYDNGLCFEFGVAGGISINWFSRRLPNLKFTGFDSFLGLKENWVGQSAPKGHFSQKGKLPKVNMNVELISGWFNETVPKYIEDNKEDIKKLNFVHIDSDTYESTLNVFDALGPHLRPGIFILFDELIGYPNWQNGEIKALEEAKTKHSFSFKYIAFTSEQALIEIV